MQIPTIDVREGKHDDQIVWVCHYSRPDMNKKALRAVQPTRVMVVCNDSLPKGKTIYYSDSHFRALSAKNKIGSQIISPVDNTGYRSHIGNELFVFDDEKSCIAEWNKQLDKHCDMITVLIENSANRWRAERELLTERMK